MAVQKRFNLSANVSDHIQLSVLGSLKADEPVESDDGERIRLSIRELNMSKDDFQTRPSLSHKKIDAEVR